MRLPKMLLRTTSQNRVISKAGRPRLQAMNNMRADVAIIGAGLGGCAAALAASRAGCRVVLTDETKWIGGQLTSEAVPPDEHPWIEAFGASRSYKALRQGIRQYYRSHLPLTNDSRKLIAFNPGNGFVSKIC